MTGLSVARCPRTADVVDTVLDGGDFDRVHVASCPACGPHVGRAAAFVRRWAGAAQEAGSGSPDPPPAAAGWTARLPLLRPAALVATVAAGVLVAWLVASGRPSGVGVVRSIGAAPAIAQAQLEALRMACEDTTAGFACVSAGPDHRHQVSVSLRNGAVVGVEARIDSTNGKTIDPSGGDVLFGRFAAAVLTPEAGAEVAAWLTANYPRCSTGCTGTLDAVRTEMRVGAQSIRLTITPR